jgi:hypothetical protein
LNWRLLLAMQAFGLLGLFLGGCASAPEKGAAAQYDPDKPQIFIPSAQVAHVKGVAMGTAKSKGWTFVESTSDTLVMQRPLNAAAAEAIEPGAGLDPKPAVVEIRTTFFPRLGGVDVVLDAQVLVHRGTDNEKRMDYTEDYRPELTRSLTSLRSAWNESRTRVVSALPPLGTHATQDDGSDAPTSEDGAPSETSYDAGAPDPAAAVNDPETQTAWGSAAAPDTPPPASELPSASAGGPMPAAPVAERSASAVPSPPAAEGGSMLALRKPQDTGVWAYYAEQYARLRGCSVADAGAALEEKTQAYEVHRVPCADGSDFLVKCNAGACRGMR